jgi:hypothetical protein
MNDMLAINVYANEDDIKRAGISRISGLEGGKGTPINYL